MVAHDADRGQRHGNRVTVAPAQSALTRLMPAVLFSELIHRCVGMLLGEPPLDGPPHIVIDSREDALGALRMSIEVTPATQKRIQTLQPVLQGLGDRGPIEDQRDTAAQAL